MRAVLKGAIALTVVVSAMAGVAAQQLKEIHPGKGGSPHVQGAWKIDGASITIEYGRPAIKGRPEADLMPPGKPWRTGADEATIITTDRALTFGKTKLAPGTYTINTQPGAAWEIIFGKLDKPGQWGVPYQAPLELSRASMTAGKTSAPVEQLTISIDDTPAGATLRIEWGTTRATVPFTVG